MEKARRLFVIMFLFILAFSSVIYMTDIGGKYHDQILNIYFLIPPFISVIAGIMAVRSYGLDNIHGQSLAFITAGLGAWFLGELTWAIYEIVLHANPYPSIADVFYLLAYPLILYGIIKEILNYKIDINPIRSLMITGVAIILSILVYHISILPASAQEATFIEHIIAVSYGIGDVALIVAVSYILVLTVDFKGGKLYESWFYIMLGVVFMLLGDLFFAMYTDQYEQAIPFFKRIDLLWILSYTFFAFGLLDIKFMIKEVQEKIKDLL